MHGDRLFRKRAVSIFVHWQHALTEILLGIFGARVELSGDPAAADEAVLVEVRTPGAMARRWGGAVVAT